MSDIPIVGKTEVDGIQLPFNAHWLSPPITERELKFVLHCISKEYRGNRRKIHDRFVEMTGTEWQEARIALKAHDLSKKIKS